MTGVDTVLSTSPVVWTLETILCTVIRVLFEKTDKMIFNNSCSHKCPHWVAGAGEHCSAAVLQSWHCDISPPRVSRYIVTSWRWLGSGDVLPRDSHCALSVPCLRSLPDIRVMFDNTCRRSLLGQFPCRKCPQGVPKKCDLSKMGKNFFFFENSA